MKVRDEPIVVGEKTDKLFMSCKDDDDDTDNVHTDNDEVVYDPAAEADNFFQSLLRRREPLPLLSSTSRHFHPPALTRIPTDSDMFIFSVKVKVRADLLVLVSQYIKEILKVGFERDAVFYALSEWMGGQYEDGVSSVFSVKNSPGRIYVEARAVKHVQELLTRCVNVVWKWDTICAIPVEERRSLLSPLRSDVDVQVGDWVKIRSGTFRKDIAQILNVDPFDDIIRVRVVPRLPPTDPIDRPAKRARTAKTRPPPQRLRIAEAFQLYGNETVRRVHYESGEEFEGFAVNGKIYDNSGFHVMDVTRDGIRRWRPSLQEIQPYFDAALERVVHEHEGRKERYTDDDLLTKGNIDLATLAIESFITVGREVEFIKGGQKGLRGRVVSTTLIGTLRVEVKRTNEETISEVEIDLQSVRPVFEIGESVSVKYGVHAGECGIIVGMDATHLFIRDKQDLINFARDTEDLLTIAAVR